MKIKYYIFAIIAIVLSLYLTACNQKEEYYFNFKEEVVTIYAGETYEVEYETNIKEVTLNCDDLEVATLDDNTITGIARGYATVYFEYDGNYYEMTICVDKKKVEIQHFNMYINGEAIDVREGSLVITNLREFFNGDTHDYYDDKTFVEWYTDPGFKNVLDYNQKITGDINIYGKYEEIVVVNEERIVVNNIVKYKTEFNESADVQTITPSYGTYANSDVKDYSNYTFVKVKYDLKNLDYYVDEIIEDGTKQDEVIPYDGFIICLKKDTAKYQSHLSSLKVGTLITLSKYSSNKANIIYVNETREVVKQTISPTDISCKYYSVYDVRDKYTIYSYQGDAKCYPASVTKVITALAALSNAKLEDTITVGDELDITYEGSSPSTAGIKKGEVWSLRQLLYALLLPSGNDAGYEIAALTVNSKYPNNTYTAKEKIALFSDMMNEVCEKVGAKNSHFLTPDGNSYYTSTGAWDERISNHYLTANDMIKIANYAFTFAGICEVVQTVSISFRIESNQSYSFNNTNSFLKSSGSYYMPNCVGLKTGTTTPAGYCLVSGVEIGRRFVIVATFNNSTSTGRYTNSKALYDLVFKK